MFRMQQQGLCLKLRNLTTFILFLKLCIGIQYKMSVVCFNSISGTAPHYLSNLLQPYTPARQIQSASDIRTFVTPLCEHKNIWWKIISLRPSVWNNLPQTLCHSDSVSLLKLPSRHTLFSNYFWTFSQLCLPPRLTVCGCVCVCACVCVVSVIVKHHVLPPCVVDGCSKNPLYYY